jgi:ribosomal protein S20
MKKSDLKNEIKDYIYEILSEADLDKTAGSAILPKTTPPTEIKKLTDKNIDVQLKEEDEEEKEDNWNKPDKDDKGFDDEKEPSKKELEKEKVKGAPSKFKTSQADFEDFKTKLKTLVKKIKAMDKGDEKDKKMAALKQFIKKPELVKAFKERDVKIDTDGLVG